MKRDPTGSGLGVRGRRLAADIRYLSEFTTLWLVIGFRNLAIWRMQTGRTRECQTSMRSPRVVLLAYQLFSLRPVSGAPRDVSGDVRGVRDADGLAAEALYGPDVGGAVFDKQVGAHGGLVLDETQVPVRNPVILEPPNRLARGRLVKVRNEESVGGYADPETFGTETA